MVMTVWPLMKEISAEILFYKNILPIQIKLFLSLISKK